jgi:hypothetical protein
LAEKEDALEIFGGLRHTNISRFQSWPVFISGSTEFFREKGLKNSLQKPGNEQHQSYLTKMGFVKRI